MGESIAKKGGVSIVEVGPDTGTGLTYCSVQLVHQEEIQLLKNDQKMNSISCASRVKLNPRLVNSRKLKKGSDSELRSITVHRMRPIAIWAFLDLSVLDQTLVFCIRSFSPARPVASTHVD